MITLAGSVGAAERFEADIRGQLETGALRNGMRLMPERELCLKYKLSRGTVRKVLLRLADEGVLRRDGRRGTRIHAEKETPKTISFCFFSSLDFSGMASNPYFNDIYRGAEQEALELGWHIAMQTGGALKESMAALKGGHGHWADGIIINGTGLPDMIPALFKASVPFVAVDYPVSIPEINSVYPDNISGARKAVSYLRGLGHDKTGFVYPMFGGEKEMQEGFKARLLGWRDALGAADGNIDAALSLGISVGTDYKLTERGEAALRQWLSSPERPSAVFVSSDCITPEFYRVAVSEGIRIPDDLSVVGFEGLSLAETLSPPLTTIKVDRELMGRLAIRRLKAVISGDSVPVSQLLPVKLIERASAKEKE